MSESNDVNINNSVVNGIHISEDVYSSIVSSTVLEIEEVVQFANSGIVGGLANLIGKKTSDSPIHIDIDEESSDITVTINLVIKYGVFIPKVVENIQKKVTTSIKEMTGQTVSSVNVRIHNIVKVEDIVEESAEEEA
ncbi:Asp23/Gls24 family envelope stress response protein [Lentisphaera marina]|uniref:Asp23/Gls24 family envelope stress response protein n=1 Tax=Lentisphaera marina TaxID=1111041 RepID=UPI002365BB11|nr:Asp23/Gls24 family envelope stress response protein [Lentisphaera marina]MDD7983848.1 Asp23/Gls24 family envelope stress response protein [Lentisphaera marina]